MPVMMDLRENGRVIYYYVTDPWTLREFMTLYEENQIIRDQQPLIMYTVANISTTRHLPRDILNATHYSPDIRHPRAGSVFFVGPSPFMRKMIETAIRLLRTDKFHVVSVEEEAWTAIREAIRNETAPDATR